MDKPTPKYGLVFAAFAIACVLTYAVRFAPVRSRFSANLTSFPKQIGEWRSEEVPIEEEIRKELGADEMLSRSYSDGYADEIGVFVIYRKYGRRDFVHRPEMCYPAAGFEIITRRYTKVPYGGKEVDAVEIVAQGKQGKQIVLYWFASGRRTEANFALQQLWMALDRLRPHKYGWAFVRITCPVLYSEEDTRDRIREFLSSAGGPLAKALTSPMVEGSSNRPKSVSGK